MRIEVSEKGFNAALKKFEFGITSYQNAFRSEYLVTGLLREIDGNNETRFYLDIELCKYQK